MDTLLMGYAVYISPSTVFSHQQSLRDAVVRLRAFRSPAKVCVWEKPLCDIDRGILVACAGEHAFPLLRTNELIRDVERRQQPENEAEVLPEREAARHALSRHGVHVLDDGERLALDDHTRTCGVEKRGELAQMFRVLAFVEYACLAYRSIVVYYGNRPRLTGVYSYEVHRSKEADVRRSGNNGEPFRTSA